MRRVVVLAMFVPAVARAQPADPDRLPGEDPPEATPAPPPVYPLALAQRPLVLPSGVVEIDPSVAVSHRWVSADPLRPDDLAGVTDASATLDANAGIAGFAVGGGLTLGLYETGVDKPIANRLFGGGAAVAYGFGPALSITAAFDANVASKAAHLYASRVIVATKLHLSPRAAIYLDARAGDNHLTTMRPAADTVVGGGQVIVEAQLAERLAFSAHAFAGVFHELDRDRLNDFMPQNRTYFGGDYGVAMLAAVSPALDLTAGVTLSSSASADLHYGIGLVIRRVP